METFSDLLNQYTQRTGISDTELSRAIGVSRQTIFRWREGATARPRHREDVLAIARKLRLNPEERDRLLLAGGFQPEEIHLPEEEKAEAAATFLPEKVDTPAGDISPTKKSRRWWWMGGIVAVIILVAAGLAVWQFYPPQERQPDIAPAASGETLVLVTHFANYAGSQIGYNIAGRLAQTLQEEIDTGNLQNVRIAVWPQVVSTRTQALQVGQGISATLVIYGEYDTGRVIVEFAHPADQNAFTDPALQQHVAGLPELSATINSDLPQLTQSLALMALGQIYVNENNFGLARPLLLRARANLDQTGDVDEETWALVNFYLGLAHQNSRPPDMDDAIDAYTEAIEAWPAMLSSRINRSAALISRSQPGDWDEALTDMDYVIEAKPDWPLAYSNRASILIILGGAENFARARVDLDKALELDPELSGIYLNRAYLAYMQDEPLDNFIPDLAKTLDIRPDDTSALNLLCWVYVVEEQAQKGLTYCEQLVQIDSSPYFRDSRGVAYAMLGHTQKAIADLESSAAWMAEQKSEVWQTPLSRRRAWLKALNAGENPFTPDLLAEIRYEFGK